MKKCDRFPLNGGNRCGPRLSYRESIVHKAVLPGLEDHAAEISMMLS